MINFATLDVFGPFKELLGGQIGKQIVKNVQNEMEYTWQDNPKMNSFAHL